MNVRKPTDYSTLFTALDALIAANLPQMKLYREVGRLVSYRPEKGAAVAAAEYLQGTYPDSAGFSPRNLRRMRDFYRTYESAPEIMTKAMTIGWTQNVVILEAELTLQEKSWYIRAVQQFGWSKLELAKQIASAAHLEMPPDLPKDVYYTGEDNYSECVNDDENPLYLPLAHLMQPNDQIYNEVSGKEGRTWNRLHRKNGRSIPDYNRLSELFYRKGLSPSPTLNVPVAPLQWLSPWPQLPSAGHGFSQWHP